MFILISNHVVLQRCKSYAEAIKELTKDKYIGTKARIVWSEGMGN